MRIPTWGGRWMAAILSVGALLSVSWPVAGDDRPAAKESGEAAAREAAARFAAVLGEYEAAQKAMYAALEKATDGAGQMAVYRTLSPDVTAFSRRMIDVATIAPKSPAARDALLWVIDHPGRREGGAFGEEYARAVARLVRDHGDDPEAVRIGVGLDNLASPQRDQLLTGFLAAAKGREAKGLARLAMGRYLLTKAMMARGSSKSRERQTFVHEGVMGDDGKLTDVKVDEDDEEFAYRMQLRQCDPESLTREAERLFEEVIAEYGDVPCVTRRTRDLETRLNSPTPEWNGRPISEESLVKLRAKLARTPTLGKVAEGQLDKMRAIVVGKPAPKIDGLDFEGKPLRLSDHRGKVVALVFWGTWCGPCMREVPHERELVEKHRGRPFAMLGVDCNEPKETAAKVIKEENMTWPNWHDGEDGNGPIAAKYHVSGFPTIFVIDDEGIIRATNTSGKHLDELVEKLVGEAEAKVKKD